MQVLSPVVSGTYDKLHLLGGEHVLDLCAAKSIHVLDRIHTFIRLPAEPPWLLQMLKHPPTYTLSSAALLHHILRY